MTTSILKVEHPKFKYSLIVGIVKAAPNQAVSPAYSPSTQFYDCGGNIDTCGECAHCAQFCDVCGTWYPLDDTCQSH